MSNEQTISTSYVDPDTGVEAEATLIYTWEPYDPGNISGPPENCYPPEGGVGVVMLCIEKVPVDEALYPELLDTLVDLAWDAELEADDAYAEYEDQYFEQLERQRELEDARDVQAEWEREQL